MARNIDLPFNGPIKQSEHATDHLAKCYTQNLYHDLSPVLFTMFEQGKQ